jgi:hypothetical protein
LQQPLGSLTLRAEAQAKEGDVLSPLLSNIYLHEFDIFMNSLIENYSN